MNCGVVCRRGLDLALLWLWYRPVATAPIQSLAWEPPYAAGAAQENGKKKKRKHAQYLKKNKLIIVTYLLPNVTIILLNALNV